MTNSKWEIEENWVSYEFESVKEKGRECDNAENNKMSRISYIGK